jgi:hypothetical protein
MAAFCTGAWPPAARFWHGWARLGTFYNPHMRLLPILSVAVTVTVALAAASGQAWAQSNTATTANPGNAARMAPVAPIAAAQSTQPSSSNQLIERIRIENAEVRIDEVRVGGETRSISVMPKGGFPAYDVQPSTGERTWKVLGF